MKAETVHEFTVSAFLLLITFKVSLKIIELDEKNRGGNIGQNL